jgi:hypothetical protein
MMGRREDDQGQFFYSFDLDKVVPPDHLVRQIDGLLDLGWVHKELAPYYSHTGRPSIDPALMRLCLARRLRLRMRRFGRVVQHSISFSGLRQQDLSAKRNMACDRNYASVSTLERQWLGKYKRALTRRSRFWATR